MEEVLKISIPLIRYEELLDTETRMEILMERLEQEESLTVEEICTICGRRKLGEELKRKSDERYARLFAKKEGSELNEVVESDV